VRSVENFAMLATDRIDFFVHAVWSLYSSSASSICAEAPWRRRRPRQPSTERWELWCRCCGWLYRFDCLPVAALPFVVSVPLD